MRADVALTAAGVAGPDHADAAGLWDAEYRGRGTLPTTTRRAPSRLFGLIDDLLPAWRGGRILDAGCGTGRNTLHLGELGFAVCGVDLSGVALGRLREAAGARPGRLCWVQASLASPWPFAAGSFAAILDFYVSCHLTAAAGGRAYRHEAARALGPGGTLVSAVFARDDGYYRTMTDAAGSPVVVDPANGIATRLYEEPELRAGAGGGLRLVRLVRHRFVDRVGARDFPRSILVSVSTKDEPGGGR